MPAYARVWNEDSGTCWRVEEHGGACVVERIRFQRPQTDQPMMMPMVVPFFPFRSSKACVLECKFRGGAGVREHGFLNYRRRVEVRAYASGRFSIVY